MDKILFPTDFSPVALNALKYAVKLAQRLEATIDLYHIYSLPFNDLNSVPHDYILQLEEEKKKWIDERFEALLQFIPEPVRGSAEGVYGVFTAFEISDLARDRNYDYIVLGTKGSHNCLDDLMGSICSCIILMADRPVIAIPEEASYKPISKIAYATSLHPDDGPVLADLFSFADRLGAEVQLVHVNSKSNEGILQEAIAQRDYPAPYSSFTVVNNYSVSKGLEKFQEEYGMDLLALFVPQRRLLERLFHKSVSKQLALHHQTPLIVFHQKKL